MKKKFSVAGLVFVALCTMAATIQWYSQQPVATALEDSMVIAVEKAVPRGYKSTTLASLRDYTLNNLAVTNYTVYSTNFWINNTYFSNYVVTNVDLSSYAYVSNYFYTANFVTNQNTTNVTITNFYAGDTLVSEFFTTNIYLDNSISNYITTNVYVTQVTTNYTSGVHVAAGTGITASTNISGSLVTFSSSGGDQVWTNDSTYIMPFAPTNAPNIASLWNQDLVRFTNHNSGFSFQQIGNSFGGVSVVSADTVYDPLDDTARSAFVAFASNTNGFTANIALESSVYSGGDTATSIVVSTNSVNIFELDHYGVVKANAYQDNSLTQGMFVAVGPSGRLINTNPPTGGDQVWTNDGDYVWLNQIPTYGITLYQDVSTNSSQYADSYIDNYVFSTNNPTTQSANSVLLSSYDDFNHRGSASLSLIAQSANTNYASILLNTDSRIALSGITFTTNIINVFDVNSNGVVTANAYVATEYAWSGPTNQIGIGEFTYTANTPCAVTNLTTTGSALLSITNASSSNITFTVISPIQIPYGETSRSYTITNGNTFFGSFRKGTHGLVFVPRGFYNP